MKFQRELFGVNDDRISPSSLMGTKSFRKSEQLFKCELLSDFKYRVLKIKVANKKRSW